MLRTLYECGVDMAQGYVVGMPRLHLPKSLPTFGTTLFEPPKPVPVAGV